MSERRGSVSRPMMAMQEVGSCSLRIERGWVVLMMAMMYELRYFLPLFNIGMNVSDEEGVWYVCEERVLRFNWVYVDEGRLLTVEKYLPIRLGCLRLRTDLLCTARVIVAARDHYRLVNPCLQLFYEPNPSLSYNSHPSYSVCIL